MSTRRWHRALGLALFLPFMGWAVTGLVFFLKPGYANAYAQLQLPVLPWNGPVPATTGTDWLEVRGLRTLLGDHLLVRSADGWRHLHRASLELWLRPAERELRPLVDAALASDSARYGTVSGLDGESWVTTTGARITLDWDTLTFGQRGRDTAVIDALYRVHYLQWTGMAPIDRALGLVGLVGVLALAVLGLRLALGVRGGS